jgi:hypothetical protein
MGRRRWERGSRNTVLPEGLAFESDFPAVSPEFPAEMSKLAEFGWIDLGFVLMLRA